MFNNYRFFYVIFCATILFSISSNAFQDSLIKPCKEPDYFQIKSLYEKVISSENKNNEESNNWIKRWLWDTRLDINSDGSFRQFVTRVNPNANENKSMNGRNKTLSQTNWIPVGPEVVPKTYEPRSCYSLGRINCIAFHPSDTNIYYIGTPGGGVWKSTGKFPNRWTPLTDNLPTLAVSDIAVDPVNPDIVYFASGDIDANGMTSDNARGIYKSTDGGLNWVETSLLSAQNFNNSLLRRILINPKKTNELIAAGRRGIWKSKDAGVTWTFILDSLITSLEMNTKNPNTLYAAMGTVSNYYGSAGIIKSTDFGDTWFELNTGITPKGEISRMAIAISSADTNYIYALGVYSNTNNYGRFGGLHSFYQSTDAGNTWHVNADYTTSVNFLGVFNGDSTDVSGQGTYDLVLQADPYNRNKVYAGGTNLWMSENGGKDWDIAGFYIYCFGPCLHADHHYAAFNPLNQYLFWCNDGGVYRTKEIKSGSKDWITNWVDRYDEIAKPGAPDYKFPTVWENLTDGLAITEFYRIGLCKNTSGVVVGGSQDNSCYYNNSGDWVNYIANYDGMDAMIDHYNPKIIYGVWQNGGLCKSVDGGKNITKRMADTLMNLGERGNWVTPIGMDPINSNTIYIGFRNFWKSTNGGFFWEKAFNIDSCENDSSNKSSITIVKNSYNNSKYLSIFKESTWAYFSGSNQWFRVPGELWISKDGGNSWSLSIKGLPLDSMNIISIDYDYYNPEIMWAGVYSNYNNINLYKSIDGGKSWSDISKPIQSGILIKTIVHQPNSLTNAVYAGTNHGVYYTDDILEQWVRFSDNLPNAIIDELEIDKNSGELYAGTYGRGIWKTNLLPDDVKDEKIINPNLSIFPNPSDGNFSIVLLSENINITGNINIKILDVTGRRVFEDKANINDNSYNFELKTGLESGVYFIQILIDGKSYSGKIVVKK